MACMRSEHEKLRGGVRLGVPQTCDVIGICGRPVRLEGCVRGGLGCWCGFGCVGLEGAQGEAQEMAMLLPGCHSRPAGLLRISTAVAESKAMQVRID